MTKEYVHDLHQEVRSISGVYELVEEGSLDLDGGTLLYALGNALIDNSCCGVYGCRYALVAGYLKSLKTRRNSKGLWISEVKPVEAGESRREIERILKEKECVQQVLFC